MHPFPTDRHGLVHRRTALTLGINDDALAAAVRRGELVRLAPGTYARTDQAESTDDSSESLYRRRSIAVATSLRDRGTAILSHDSAAALHGLSLLHPERDIVHLTKRQSSGGFARGHRHVHVGPLPPEDVTLIDGIQVTSLERTAVDIASSGDFAQAVVAFDRALAMDADRAIMSAKLDARSRWPGSATARRALKNANPLAESVGESWSRAQMIAAGLPVPRLQYTFHTPGGNAKTDFDWDGLLVGEFDGLQKYGMRPGETPRQALIREKRREDALRAMGIMVVRWTWATLERGELVDLLRPWLEKLKRTAS